MLSYYILFLKEVLILLSKEQKKVVAKKEGPALVLAVPGAGKTTVLIHRIANLIEKHSVDPRRILSITFSRASANDMKMRFNQDFKHISQGVSFSTIHSFCFFIVRDYSYIVRRRLTLIEDFKNPQNKYNILRAIYRERNGLAITDDKLENLINYIGYVKNMMIYPEDLKARDIANFPDIYRDYEAYKRKNDLIDFDDMLSLSYQILRQDQRLLNKYRSMYDYIQVDEGQDTSKIQLEIIKLIARPKNNLLIVADDDQSIYGFRGAYPDGLFKFREDYRDMDTFFMEENFRSCQEIVELSNGFISKNTKRFKKTIYTKNANHPGLKLLKYRNMEEQYRLIVQDLLQNNTQDIAILYRNNISGIGIGSFLKDQGLDFYMKDSSLKFFNHWIVRDFLNFLRFSQDITNLELYEEIYYKTKDYISKKQVDYCRKLNSTSSVFLRLKDYPGLFRKDIYRLNSLELKFKKLSKLRPEESIDFILYDLNYDEYLREYAQKFGYVYSSLIKILDSLKVVASNTANLDEFEMKINELRDYCIRSSQGPGKIFLSTIHSAKGLEFDSVYLIDLIDGEFPSSSAIDSFEEGDLNLLEEERRLFYVAMTRARYFLRIFQEDRRSAEPSRFIKEIKI